MQHIQDKEFDRLFKARFANAEIQPSANLWNNIEQKLKPNRKHILPVYQMAAAVALLALTIGLLVPKTEKIRLHTPVLAVNNIKPATIVSETKEEIIITDDKDESTPLIIAPRLKTSNGVQKIVVMQPEQLISRPDNKVLDLINQVPEMKQETIVPVEEKMANISVEDNLNSVIESGQPEHRGIRNVGDLVNFVVNKVDKREKKFLQFSTDDDDNSSLIAINIGILKINKRSDN